MPPIPASIPATPAAPAPWWRFGIVWLVIAGPAAVIVAGVATMAVAFHGADPQVAADPSGAAPIARTVTTSTAPALQARNHAATSAR